jgi:Mce-associated membrane protein
MPDANAPHDDSAAPDPDTRALLEEVEAEAAAAEALAAAAQARARAARLRREALGLPDPAAVLGDDEYYEDEDDDETATEHYDEDYDQEYYGDYYDAEDAEDAEDAQAAEPTALRRWLLTIAAVTAFVLTCAFIGVSAYMTLQHRDTSKHRQREAAFVAGAKQDVTYMISLDYNKAKDDVQRVIDNSTGQFKDDFQHQANDFISVVTQSKAVTEGKVNAAALESISGNSAVVLVSATSQITNSPPGKDEPPRMWRLRVTIDDVGGKYKMAKVEYVP